MGSSILTLVFSSGGAMVRVTDYWPEVADDLTRVSWSHATNSKALLNQALADSTMMIEADVSLGPGNTPIMAHPPANTSDLSLQQFLETVLESTEGGAKKGIKLDFKLLGVVEPSLSMLEGLRDRLAIPLWLNADILQGPGGGVPVEGNDFLNVCKRIFPGATLSVGWTTGPEGQYSKDDFDKMRNLLLQHNVTSPVTLPLRASLAVNSVEPISEFLLQMENLNPFPLSLTIWTGASDQVDRNALHRFIELVGKERVFLDVPWAGPCGIVKNTGIPGFCKNTVPYRTGMKFLIPLGSALRAQGWGMYIFGIFGIWGVCFNGNYRLILDI